MAIPAIWRQSDNYLISDKCIEWGRWQETSGIQENELLIGGIYHLEHVGNPHKEGSATFIFADDRPTSTLANLAILMACRRDMQPVIFRDFVGVLTVCEIVTDIGIESHGASRVVERNKAKVNLRPQGSI